MGGKVVECEVDWILQRGIEQGREQGFTQGREQGLAQGLEQGRSKMIENLLKFPTGINDLVGKVRRFVNFSKTTGNIWKGRNM